MTREEVIKHFESYIGNECYTDFYQNACRMAVEALRAQQPTANPDGSRWEGCKSCKEVDLDWLVGYKGWKYCPNCGRPLTEETRSELERRMSGG